MSNHLGNVLVTISDKKLAVASTTDPNLIAYYNADVVTANDYYPFGMTMPGRKFSQANSSYRYGFNGQENSDEIAASLTTAMYWEYDSRIGRRWNVDPKALHKESVYSCFGGSPIKNKDPNGDIFDVANNSNSRNAVASTVNEKNRGLLKYNGNTLTVDFGNRTPKEIKKLLNADKGLKLIDNISKDSKKIFFGVVNNKDKLEGKSFDGKTTYEIGDDTDPLYPQNHILSASKTSRFIDGGVGEKGEVDFKPMDENYDGQVLIRDGTFFRNELTGVDKSTFTPIYQLVAISTAAVVSHELYESFDRTINNQPYMRADGTGAHKNAITAAGDSFGTTEANQGKADKFFNFNYDRQKSIHELMVEKFLKDILKE